MPLAGVGVLWLNGRADKGGQVQNLIGLVVGLIVIIVLIYIIASLW